MAIEYRGTACTCVPNAPTTDHSALENVADSPKVNSEVEDGLAVGLIALADADEVAVPVGVPVPNVDAVGVADPLGVPELEGVPLLLPLLPGVPEGQAF